MCKVVHHAHMERVRAPDALPTLQVLWLEVVLDFCYTPSSCAIDLVGALILFRGLTLVGNFTVGPKMLFAERIPSRVPLASKWGRSAGEHWRARKHTVDAIQQPVALSRKFYKLYI